MTQKIIGKLVMAVTALSLFATSLAQQAAVTPEDYGSVVDTGVFTNVGAAQVGILAIATAAGLGYLILKVGVRNTWKFVNQMFR